MPRFTITQPPFEAMQEISFEDFVGLCKGLSVTSAAASGEGSRGPDFLEIGLSKTFNLRVQARGGELFVSVVPTLNFGDLPPVRFEIISEGEIVTAELLEHRLYYLRQTYALMFLLESGREEELANLLRAQPQVDIEQALVDENDKLIVQEATPGSLILSLVAKTKVSYQAIIYASSLIFERGREAFLKRVEAKADLARLEVMDRALDLKIKAVDAAIEAAKKLNDIKDESIRAPIKDRFLSDVDKFLDAAPPPHVITYETAPQDDDPRP